MQENIKQVIVKNTVRKEFKTAPIFQYDVGHVLSFEGFNLPEAFEVHFSLTESGDAVTQVGSEGEVAVPDILVQDGRGLYAWLYISDEETGLTKFTIQIPVTRRAKPTDQVPTPVEQSEIQQAIAALNTGVARAETAAENAEQSEENASQYAENAYNSSEAAASAAESAEGDSRTATEKAQEALTAALDADRKAQNASESAQLASQKASDASGFADDAQGSAQNASDFAQSAQEYAQTAGQKATEATRSSENATQKAQEAASHASDAEGYAIDADTAKRGAETAKTAAQTAASNAQGSATTASGSATAAAQSASAAAQSATAASETAAQFEEDITQLKSAIASNEIQTFDDIGYLSLIDFEVEKGTTQRELLRFNIKNGDTISFDIVLKEAVGTNTYFYLQTADGQNLFPYSSYGIGGTATEGHTQYSANADYNNAVLKYTISNSASKNALFISLKVTNLSFIDVIGNLNNDVDELNNAFDYDYIPVQISSASDGYINTSGQVTGTGAAARHVSIDIDSSYVGKQFHITGSLWWGLLPYVFVATDSSIEYPSYSGTGTVQTKTDIPFTATKTGTLYINYHTDKPEHHAEVYELSNIKASKLPGDLVYSFSAIQNYKELSYTKTTKKYLNGSTGAITDTTSDNAVITNNIEVKGGFPYLITTEHFWAQGMYVFYDENMNYLTGKSSQNSGTITKIWNEKVIAPENSKYLIVAEWAQTNFPDISVFEGVKSSIIPSKKWDGVKWVCVGDSLTEQNTKATYHYYDHVSARTGVEPYIMGVGGTGYASGSGSSNAFYQRISSIPDDADVITIFGSFNDLSSGLNLGNVTDDATTTIAGCMNKTIENILSVIPTANIGIVAPCPWGSTRPSASGDACAYVEMLKSVAERWSIPFLDLWRNSGLRPWDANFAAIAYPSGDVVHPNNVGQGILAPKFESFLETLLI